MAKSKAVLAPAPPTQQSVRDRSVKIDKPFSLEQGPGAGNSFTIWMASIADTFQPWGVHVTLRDEQLRDWWHTESVLSGAIYTVTAANAGFKWSLEGPEQTIEQVKLLLDHADGGKGWNQFIQKLSIDLYTQDNGAFIEIVRQTDSPSSPIVGIYHLESLRCTRTGDLETPVIYRDQHGGQHKMPWYSVIPLSEMPSPIETMYGVQYCAVTRVLRAAQIMRDIAIYRGEKVGGRFTEAIHVIGGVKQTDIDDVKNRAQESADNMGIARYLAPIIITSLDPNTPVSSVTLNLKSLPEAFDLDQEMQTYIAQIALGFGRDYQEFAPLPRGNLGSGQQSEILHLKTRGKGPAAFMDLITYALNAFVMPRTVTFEFTVQDIAAEKEEAEVKKVRAEGRKIRIDSGEISDIIARQIAQDDGDLDIKYLELMGEADLTPEMLVQEGEKLDRDTADVVDIQKGIVEVRDLDDYIGGIKSWVQRAIAKTRKDTEESEAIQALKVAAQSLADTADEPPVINVHVPEQKTPEIIVQAPDVTVNVPEQKAPEIKVEVPPAQIEVKVEIPESDEVTEIVDRDSEGRIKKVVKKKVRK